MVKFAILCHMFFWHMLHTPLHFFFVVLYCNYKLVCVHAKFKKWCNLRVSVICFSSICVIHHCTFSSLSSIAITNWYVFMQNLKNGAICDSLSYVFLAYASYTTALFLRCPLLQLQCVRAKFKKWWNFRFSVIIFLAYAAYTTALFLRCPLLKLQLVCFMQIVFFNKINCILCKFNIKQYSEI